MPYTKVERRLVQLRMLLASSCSCHTLTELDEVVVRPSSPHHKQEVLELVVGVSHPIVLVDVGWWSECLG